MNIREGMRRLGILVGAAGGLVGGFLGYGEAQPLWQTHVAYRKFESLMALPIMHKVASTVKEYQADSSRLDFLAREYGGSTECRTPPLDYSAIVASAGSVVFERAKINVPPGYTLDKDPAPCSIVVQVNLNGIKEVYVDKVGGISEIDLTTGEGVPKTDPPHLQSHGAIVLYPIMGFLIPWCALRLLTWAGSGFFEAPR